MRKLVAMEVVESFEMMEWRHGEDAQDRVLTFFQNNNSIKLKCYFLFFLWKKLTVIWRNHHITVNFMNA